MEGQRGWQKRDLGARRFLYIWVDGVYFKSRMHEEKQCVLVVVGADEFGRKVLLAMTDGFRESTESWRELLLDLKRRGLKQDPKLANGDGAPQPDLTFCSYLADPTSGFTIQRNFCQAGLSFPPHDRPYLVPKDLGRSAVARATTTHRGEACADGTDGDGRMALAQSGVEVVA